MRIRVTFAKTDEMRFTSHLDLHRTWERTFRRARLPLSYSQGFNPHPRINLASALPLGFTGEGEIVDAWLEEVMPLPEMEEALARAVPPGIRIRQVEEVDLRRPALQTELEASLYEILLPELLSDLDERLGQLLSAETLPRERRGKVYDLRPLIQELVRLTDDPQSRPRLLARLCARESATGRPEEILLALGIVPERARVHRQRLLFREAG